MLRNQRFQLLLEDIRRNTIKWAEGAVANDKGTSTSTIQKVTSIIPYLTLGLLMIVHDEVERFLIQSS